MRRIVFFFIISLFITSCSTQQVKESFLKLFGNNKEEIATNSEVDTTISNEEIPIADISFVKNTWCDSVEFQKQQCKITYSCEYPQINGSVAAQNIQYWICEKFGDKKHEYYNNIPGLLSTKGKEILKSITNSNKNNVEVLEDFYSGGSWTSEISIKRIFENDTCVTLSLSCAENAYYTAEEREAITFDKRTGHQYGIDLLDKYNKASLNRLLIDGFKKYYNTTSTEVVIKTLNIDKNTFYNDIPLPSTTPYISRDSIVLIYMPYEFKKLYNTPIVKIPLGNTNSATSTNYLFDENDDITNFRCPCLYLILGSNFYDDNRNLIFRDTTHMLGSPIGEVKDGWLRADNIELDLIDTYDETEKFILPKSPTGNYWAPSSDVAELSTLADGGLWFCLREEPSFVSKIKYSSFHFSRFEVLDIKGAWIKVGIIEHLLDEEGIYSSISRKNIEGWIPIEHTCNNPLTVCN